MSRSTISRTERTHQSMARSGLFDIPSSDAQAVSGPNMQNRSPCAESSFPRCLNCFPGALQAPAPWCSPPGPDAHPRSSAPCWHCARPPCDVVCALLCSSRTRLQPRRPNGAP
ncbi:hypothetical protein C2E23DRAFT_131434 [Lenzites betulinus]|nr:hypothetical protein C2E23DRAFT_52387 [Lenzites betulinus]KAH9853174.1 hypothetical protein C2E23DRAFT_131434 [Lenzites betulinus]